MKQIITLSGGGFLMEKSQSADKYILAQSKKAKPKICLLPTASGDNGQLSAAFEYIFEQYGAKPSTLFTINPQTSKFADHILSQDIIYVSGGNTKSMLAIWREWGIDTILKAAYDKNIILAGVSAGAVCWFEECLTDSIPNRFTVLPCLGLLKGSHCVHYNEEERRQAYIEHVKRGKIKPGLAGENKTIFHFINDKLEKVLSTRKNNKAAAYSVNTANETFIQPEAI